MTGVTIFHPDFPSAHPLGGASISCGSGISFRFPLHLLSISTLFSDAAQISSASTGSSSENHDDHITNETIELPNVPPQGFHVLLTALHPIRPYHTLSDKIATLATKTVEDIMEVYYVAQILDIPFSTLSRLLIPYFPDPFVKFALSTAISPAYGSEEDRDLIQQMVVGTFNLKIHSMSRLAEILLIELNPHYHVRLRRLLRERQRLPPSLNSALRDEPTPDGLDDFTKACQKLSCPAIQSVQKKSWSQLRARVASFVWHGLTEERCVLGNRCQVANGILEEACMGCPRCYERLSAAIGKAINDAEAQLPARV